MLRGKIFNLRKISANLYAFEAQRNYEATINVGIEKFVHRLKKMSIIFLLFVILESSFTYLEKQTRTFTYTCVYIDYTCYLVKPKQTQ